MLSQVTQKERNALVTHLRHPLLQKTKANNFGFCVHPEVHTKTHKILMALLSVHSNTKTYSLFCLQMVTHTHTNTSTPLPPTHTQGHPQINTYNCSAIHALVSNESQNCYIHNLKSKITYFLVKWISCFLTCNLHCTSAILSKVTIILGIQCVCACVYVGAKGWTRA